jgi:hypothetical protein
MGAFAWSTDPCAPACAPRLAEHVRECSNAFGTDQATHGACTAGARADYGACLQLCNSGPEGPDIAIAGLATFSFTPKTPEARAGHSLRIQTTAQTYYVSTVNGFGDGSGRVNELTIRIDGTIVASLADMTTRSATEHAVQFGAGSHVLQVTSTTLTDGVITVLVSNTPVLAEPE